ncbi:MAG: hypothetical protein SVV80_05390 [Planctomycetota bacterium]|nr:hypothetical protein [Planctomycetota bacterium]
MSDIQNQKVIGETVHQVPPIQYQPAGDATGGLIPYKNVPALVTYYLGILSLIPGVGLILGLAAFVLGIAGLVKADKHPEVKGQVHAWVGIIIGGLCGFGHVVLVVFLVIIPVLTNKPPF